MEERAKESVKVMDRRLFTRAGERRFPADAAPPPAEPAEPPPIESRAPSSTAPEIPASTLFENLVGFLAENAIYGLRAGAPLSSFTIFIDFLETLREKTRGNLTERESGALEGALGEMKLTYLQMSKKPGGKGP